MESFQFGIFPKFPSLTSHGNLPETFHPFATLAGTTLFNTEKPKGQNSAHRTQWREKPMVMHDTDGEDVKQLHVKKPELSL